MLPVVLGAIAYNGAQGGALSLNHLPTGALLSEFAGLSKV